MSHQPECLLYIYKKCSTCQKALQFLKMNRVTFESREITETPPSLEDLYAMLTYAGDVKKLFNTSGLLYKELKLSQKLSTMPLEEALNLLTHNGMLVKRPFLLTKTFGLLGFHAQRYAFHLSNKI